MSLYKRKDSSIWRVRFTHKGNRIQQSSGTSERIKAEEYEAKLKASLWEQERLGVKPIYTWNDAVLGISMRRNIRRHRPATFHGCAGWINT